MSSDHLNTDEISADTGERTVYLDVIDTPPESQADPLAGNQLKPALDVSPGRNTEQNPRAFLFYHLTNSTIMSFIILDPQ